MNESEAHVQSYSLYGKEDSSEQKIVPSVFVFFLIYSQLPSAAQFIFYCCLPPIKKKKSYIRRSAMQRLYKSFSTQKLIFKKQIKPLYAVLQIPCKTNEGKNVKVRKLGKYVK